MSCPQLAVIVLAICVVARSSIVLKSMYSVNNVGPMLNRSHIHYSSSSQLASFLSSNILRGYFDSSSHPEVEPSHLKI